MTYRQWLDFFERKSGEEYEPSNGWMILYNPDKGFCDIKIDEGIVMARQAAGDIKHWKNEVERIARGLGIKNAGTYVSRKIKPYIRLVGYKITAEEHETNENGKDVARYHLIDKDGHKGLATYGFVTEAGNDCYLVTWEV